SSRQCEASVLGHSESSRCVRRRSSREGAEAMSYECELTPRQLCELLNFVLDLPHRAGVRGTVICAAISPVVVDSSPTRPTRAHIERWCNTQLAKAGLIPRTGVKYGVVAPREISRWMVRAA